MALLALTIRAVTLTTTRLTSVVKVSVFGTARVMTRSAYHPFWLIGALALVLWTQRHKLRRRSVEPKLNQADVISLRANGTISAVFRCRSSSTSFGRCLPWLSEMGAACAPCTRIVVLWTRRAWRRVWFLDHTVRLGRHVRHLLQHRGAWCRTARRQRSRSRVRGATNRMVDRMNTQGDRRNGGCVSDRPVIPSTCARYLCVALHCQRRHVHFWTRIRGRDRRRNSRRNRGDDSLLCSPTLARNSVLQPLPVALANNRAGHQTEFGAHQIVADVVSARTHARCDSVVLLARRGAASEVAIRQTKGSRHRVMNHSRYR